MDGSETIEHIGIISEITDSLFLVSIAPQTACGNCRARGGCSIGETDSKIIEVPKNLADNYSVGETIKVVIAQTLGIKALLFGYLLPFFVLITALIISISFGAGEGLAALNSLAFTGLYYYILYLFNDKLKKRFSFRIKKCNTEIA